MFFVKLLILAGRINDVAIPTFRIIRVVIHALLVLGGPFFAYCPNPPSANIAFCGITINRERAFSLRVGSSSSI